MSEIVDVLDYCNKISEKLLAYDSQSGEGKAIKMLVDITRGLHCDNNILQDRIKQLEEQLTWKPIESCPKDSRILLVLEDRSVVVGSFSEMCEKFWNSENAEFIDSDRKLLGWLPIPTAPQIEEK